MFLEFIRWVHIIGAAVLLGTGSGIAFFMVMAHRTRDAKIIAHTAGIVVIADWILTTSAVILQPITGAILAHQLGWPLFNGWVGLSLLLYIFVVIFWLPMIWIQHQLRDIARESAKTAAPLPERYSKLYRIWFAAGFPAFIAVLIIVWLMITRPVWQTLTNKPLHPFLKRGYNRILKPRIIF